VCLHNRLACTTGDSITGSATRYEDAVSLLMLSTSTDGTVIMLLVYSGKDERHPATRDGVSGDLAPS